MIVAQFDRLEPGVIGLAKELTGASEDIESGVVNGFAAIRTCSRIAHGQRRVWNGEKWKGSKSRFQLLNELI